MRNIKFRAWHKNMKSMCQNVTTDLLDRDYLEFMQYTGLMDKNDTEIYEGDILALPFKEGRIGSTEKVYRYVVDYDENFCTFYLKGNEELLGQPLCCNDNLRFAEVVGNIYENKELLSKTN